MVDDKQKHQTIFSTPFDNAKSNYIFGSNTPGHAISQQNRWEKAGGKGLTLDSSKVGISVIASRQKSKEPN